MTDKGGRVREDVYVSVGSVCIHICVFYFLISLIIINLVAGKPCVFEKTRQTQVIHIIPELDILRITRRTHDRCTQINIRHIHNISDSNTMTR